MIKLYENIKQRRKELHLSQAELASKVGYKDKGSISRIENGKLDLSQTMIEIFAKALECSPAYLMGWTSVLDNQNAIKETRTNVMSAINKMQQELEEMKTQDYLISLSDDEQLLLEMFRKADGDVQKRILKYANMELNE